MLLSNCVEHIIHNHVHKRARARTRLGILSLLSLLLLLLFNLPDSAGEQSVTMLDDNDDDDDDDETVVMRLNCTSQPACWHARNVLQAAACRPI